MLLSCNNLQKSRLRALGKSASAHIASLAHVHEAYLRLVGEGLGPHCDHRGHFFAARPPPGLDFLRRFGPPCRMTW